MKILLVDDHKMMRDGLRAILAGRAEMVVVGEAADGEEAVVKAEALEPDVVVMDISLPRINGIEATRRVVRAVPQARVIALSMNSDHRYVRAMFEAGAVGYLLKNAASDELLRAIGTVAQGGRYVSPAIADVVVAGLVRGAAAPAALSARERDVLKLIADGRTSKEIAAALRVAVSTVETYRRQIMDKLGLHSIAELTKYALRTGISSVD